MYHALKSKHQKPRAKNWCSSFPKNVASENCSRPTTAFTVSLRFLSFCGPTPFPDPVFPKNAGFLADQDFDLILEASFLACGFVCRVRSNSLCGNPGKIRIIRKILMTKNLGFPTINLLCCHIKLMFCHINVTSKNAGGSAIFCIS